MPLARNRQSNQGLGISVEEPSAQLRDNLDIAVDGGVIVSQVESGSMAAQVGVRQGDLILSINGLNIESLEDFNEAVSSTRLSAGVRMRVHRDGGTRFVFMKSSG